MLKRELGGGTILDLGIYCIQFSLLAFNGKRWVSNTNSTTKAGVLNEKYHVKVCPILYFYTKDQMPLTLLVIWARLMSQVWTQMFQEPSFIVMAVLLDSRLIVAPIWKKKPLYMVQKVGIEFQSFLSIKHLEEFQSHQLRFDLILFRFNKTARAFLDCY